jgi:hypothetical protein
MDQNSFGVLAIIVLLVAGIIIYNHYLEEKRKKLRKTVESLGAKRYFRFGRYMFGLESHNPVQNVYCIETDDIFHFSTDDGRLFGKIDKTNVTSVSAADEAKAALAVQRFKVDTSAVLYYLTIGVKGAGFSSQAIFAFPSLQAANQGNNDIRHGLEGFTLDEQPALDAPTATTPTQNVKERLAKLEELKGAGLIIEADYQQQKQRILDSI